MYITFARIYIRLQVSPSPPPTFNFAPLAALLLYISMLSDLFLINTIPALLFTPAINVYTNALYHALMVATIRMDYTEK